MEVVNVLRGEQEAPSERDGFRNRDTPLATRIGGSEIGGSLYELPAGQRTFPYHFHHANEEWLIVVVGRLKLRVPRGEQELRAGDVVCFPRGPQGAHQVRNDEREPARFLVLSTVIQPEILEYPDSGKIGVRAPGISFNVAREPELGYWEGEE